MKYCTTLFSGIVLLTLSLTFSGCPKKTETAAIPENPAEISAGTPTTNPAPGTEKAAVNPEKQKEPAEQTAFSSAGLHSIYFDYDQTFITTHERSTMISNADWLKAHPSAKIRIEGDCDERGTNEYNQALGQRRASAARKFLTDLGVSGSRISLISYGKEKPVCRESNDACWQKNRRDDFIVTTE